MSTPRDPLTPEELNGWMALFPDVDSSLAGVSLHLLAVMALNSDSA